jgi:chloramphenicol-sensitive protein RarD
MKHKELFAASLAYYICPLLTVAGAALVFKEQFSTQQKLAMALLVSGVVLPAAVEGKLPIVAILIAASWSAYTLTRRYVNRPALQALFVETFSLTIVLSVVLPAMLGGSALVPAETDARLFGLFALSGVVTAVPIVLLIEGMKLASLRAVGMLQYVAPTLTLAVSVLCLGGTTTREQLLSLGLVWAGLLVFFSEDLSRAAVTCIRWSAAVCSQLYRKRFGKLEKELAGLR